MNRINLIKLSETSKEQFLMHSRRKLFFLFVIIIILKENPGIQEWKMQWNDTENENEHDQLHWTNFTVLK